MAHFRGVVQGNRGDASRLGSKDSGLSVEAQSWDGKVVTGLHYNHTDNRNVAQVALRQHSNGAGTRATLYFGPVSHVELSGILPTLPLFGEIGVVLQAVLRGRIDATVMAAQMLEKLRSLELVGDENGNDHE